MGVAPPPPVPGGVIERLRSDMRWQKAARGQFPPGELSFSVRRTREFEHDPLPLLLRLHEEYGPVFAMRLMYAPVVFALGPEANHYMTVSAASNFRWRDGAMGDLIPLLGDGLLTTDGDYHRRARRIMLPAFHREQIAAATGSWRRSPSGRSRLAPGRSTRPVRLDPPARAARRDAGAVRLQPTPARATRAGPAVRAGARLLGQGLRGADAARPGRAWRAMNSARRGSTR